MTEVSRSVIRSRSRSTKPQRRFAHLFGENPRPDIVARIQAGADYNIERPGLLAGEGEGAELPGAWMGQAEPGGTLERRLQAGQQDQPR